MDAKQKQAVKLTLGWGVLVTLPIVAMLAPVFLFRIDPRQPPDPRAAVLHTELWFLGLLAAAAFYLSGSERQWSPVVRLGLFVVSFGLFVWAIRWAIAA